MRMGVETEFGVAGGWKAEKAYAIDRAAMNGRSYLPSVKEGRFLANGARVYVDLHLHNEYATPETQAPLDLVTCELAGRQLMAHAANQCDETLLCSNLDPGSGHTWGTHENYECQQSLPTRCLRSLYVHLATRIIYTGAGGLHPDHPGILPVFSPRATRLVGSHSSQGIARKTLVFDKPEHYGSGQRLHLFCGESLLSHTANYLKYGATALVVALLDAGHSVGPGCFIEPTVRILHALNRDANCGRRFLLDDGQRLTAIEVQFRFLEAVEAYLLELPEWASAVTGLWRQTLERLSGEPLRLAGTLDWFIYRRCLASLLEEHEISSERLNHLNQLALAGAGGSRADLEKLRRLRAAANELYLRFHLLGADSLFGWLERHEAVDHRLDEVTDRDIETALTQPPPGRAANRSRLILKYHSAKELTVSWNTLTDASGCRLLAISDVVGEGEREEWEAQQGDRSNRHRDYVRRLFRTGRYEETIAELNQHELVGSTRGELGDNEILCLSYARLGQIDRAVWCVDHCFGETLSRMGEIALRLFVWVEAGLASPLKMMEPLVRQGEFAISQGGPRCARQEYYRFVIRMNQIRFLARRGTLEQAISVAEHIIRSRNNQGRSRMYARTRCYYGEALRLAGRIGEAREQVDASVVAHTRESMYGDLADHSLPLLAKLTDDSAALEHLRKAEAIQRRTHNPLGLARTLCLKARRLGIDEGRTEVAALQQSVPALRQCRVAEKVVSHWDQWIDRHDQAELDDYWGL